MQIDIRGQNVAVSGNLAAHCLDRLDRALRPFSSRIARVQIVFVDLNGPRNGPAQACRATVELLNGGRVRFSSRAEDYYQAAAQTIAGIVRPVQRTLTRPRSLRNGPTLPAA
ncbi:MAG TPA: HPF/RaiA family ribosome-associated protein [Polyangiales bacterium]|nr:HPF/RaiA family ribosome-associated protein [Polyangiales bacterium]